MLYGNKILCQARQGQKYGGMISVKAVVREMVRACRNTGTRFARLYRRQTPKTFLDLHLHYNGQMCPSSTFTSERKETMVTD